MSTINIEVGYNSEIEKIELYSKIQSFFRNLFGVLGAFLILVILLPIVLLIEITAYIFLSRGLKSTKKHFAELYNDFHNFNNREKIEAHLELERYCNKYSHISELEKVSIFIPFDNKIKEIIEEFAKAESTFKRSIYPEIDKEISDDHKAELLDKFSDLDDWNDEELNIYEDVYIK